MKNNVFKYLLFAIVAALIFLPMWFVPFLQKEIPTLQVEEVVGFFGEKKKPNFHGKRWMSGEFQNAFESFVKAKNPLHPTAIRLKSQMDYFFYGDIMHANILSGKEGFLFQKEGCEALIGRDFKGGKWMEERADKLAFIVDYFKKEGVEFLVLMPPLKARFYEKYLPSFYKKNKTEKTNWNVFPKILKEKNIPVLDFSFLEKYKEKKSPEGKVIPIYPPSGQHWTKYGAAVASEAIKEELERILEIEMVEMDWRNNIEWSEAQVAFDNELVAGANFLWNPKLDPLPYPTINYIENDSTSKPSVLAVGDSFYKLIYEFGIVEGLFDKSSTFWYYNHEIFPSQLLDGKFLTNKDLDMIEEIKKRDVVILTVFEDNLDRFVFGFVDQVFDLIHNGN